MSFSPLTDGHDKTGWGPTGRRFLYCTAAFCFGAVDQYLGASWVSTHVGFWTIAVSGLSAPWLLLAFGAGWFEADRRAALAMGALATFTGLAGYFVLTLSPIEGVSTANVHAVQFLHSQLHLILPALVTGPCFGLLGYVSRTSRSIVGAVTIAAAFCLEPVVTVAAHPFTAQLPAPAPLTVSVCEAVIGVMIGAVLFVKRAERQT